MGHCPSVGSAARRVAGRPLGGSGTLAGVKLGVPQQGDPRQARDSDSPRRGDHPAGGAQEIASLLGVPVVVKAQVLAGGRGKAGGVKLAATPEEAEARAAEILAIRIAGGPVRTLLVTPAVDIAHEYYLAAILDRGAKTVTLIASAEEIEIEEVAHELRRGPPRPRSADRAASRAMSKRSPNSRPIPRFIGPALASHRRGAGRRLLRLGRGAGRDQPMAVAGDGRLLALDAKVVVDDSALPATPISRPCATSPRKSRPRSRPARRASATSSWTGRSAAW